LFNKEIFINRKKIVFKRKMMKKILGISVIMSLLIISVIAAVQININTLGDGHRISIVIRETGKLTTLESFHQSTNDGKVVISTTSSPNLIDIITTLRKDTVTILNENFESVDANKPIFINLIPGSVSISNEDPNAVVEKPEINETEAINETREAIENTTVVSEVIENPNKQTGKLTGFAVSSIKSISSSKITYYVIGGLFIAAVFVFIMIKRKNNFSKEFKTSNLRLNFQTPSNPSQDDSKILEAERKIQEAREELDDIKNRKGKIREAEEKLQRDKEELRRLREE
jgi:hypothetical protein